MVLVVRLLQKGYMRRMLFLQVLVQHNLRHPCGDECDVAGTLLQQHCPDQP
jgi:hypothetical protein